jgi:predicted  nucleic acid-binding Zn-ribbon protein
MQHAEHLIQILQQQRNQAMDQLAAAMASLMVAQKRITELEAQKDATEPV